MMMAVCDACGKQKAGWTNGVDWFSPSDWYSRKAGNENLQACSRECLKKIDATRNEEVPTLPI